MDPDMSQNNPIKLRGLDNWAVWRFQTRVNLLAIEALGHVDGTNPRPSPPAQDADAATRRSYETLLREWSNIEGKAQRLIVTTLNEERMLHIMHCESSKDMWDTLKGTFETKTATSIHMLHQR